MENSLFLSVWFLALIKFYDQCFVSLDGVKRFIFDLINHYRRRGDEEEGG